MFLVVFLLVLLLYGLLHFSPIQTWVAKKITSYLSGELHTRVSLKKVDIGFFNKINLEGLMIEDRNRDTLLFAGSSSVKITDWFFLKDRYTLHYLSLSDASVYIGRTDSVWNYQFLIDYFIGPRTGNKNAGSTEIGIGEIHLSNIQFIQKDEWFGQDMQASIKKADIRIEGIDYKKKQVIISDMYLEKPIFSMSDYTGLEPADSSVLITNKTSENKAYKWNNSGWELQLNKMQLFDGQFISDKESNRLAYTGRFDEMHINFAAISGSISHLLFRHDTLQAEIQLTSKEHSGLDIKKLQAVMRFTPEIMEFDRMNLETNKSRLGNYYSMSYNSFNIDMNKFIKNVTLEARLTGSIISSDDLAFFAPQLIGWNRTFTIDGIAKGSIENFSAKKMQVKSGNTFISGDLAMRGLPDINSTFIDFRGEDLKTSYTELASIIPALKNNSPSQLNKIGNISYKGNFTGFLNDFVTYGTIKSDYGTITADLNMKLPTNGTPSYSGKLETNGFRLGDFFNNKALGSISMQGDVKGSGFKLSNLNAYFNGKIRQFELNGYNYQQLEIKGDFKKDLFTGHLKIDDPNLKIKNLDGTLRLSDKELAFNLDADLQYAHLKNLHLSNKNFELKGLFSLNFTGNNIDNFLGTAKVYDATLLLDSSAMPFNSLQLSSMMDGDKKVLTLRSDEIDASLTGKFTILELPDAFSFFLSRYYPVYIKKPGYTLNNQDFTFKIKTGQVDQYTRLFDRRLDGLNDASISGNLNLAKYELNVRGVIPEFIFDNKKFKNIHIAGNGNRDTLFANIAVDDIALSDSLHFPNTNLQLTANNDVSVIRLKTSAGETLNDAELNASIQTMADGVKIQFSPSSFIINNKKWSLEKDGELTVRNNFLDANEIRFSQGNQQISISTELSDLTDETNIVAKLSEVRIGDFTPFIFSNPTLKGTLTGTATIKDPFGKFGIAFKGVSDSFSLDNNYIGKVQLEADANTLSGETRFKVAATEKDNDFKIQGRYNYKDSSSGNIDIDLLAEKLNLSILEPYLGTVFSEMKGTAKSNLKLSSGPKHPYLTGKVTIDSGSLKVAYTQCKYFLKNETLNFGKDIIDLGIIQLKDSLKNTGVVSGKLYHKFFESFSFENIRFETEKMLLLNTSKLDNSLFYGNVTGSALMTLNGPVNNMLMNINGQPSSFDSSHIYLPIGSSKESNSMDYIEFIQFGTLMADSLKLNESTNIIVNMNLIANPACKIDVILDEATGDIIKGQGTGSLNIRVGNKEPMTMRGKYEITKGEYTFNFQTFLKKAFTLNRGSINWNGDPYQAIIDLEAQYVAQDVDISSLNNFGNLSSGSVSRQSEDVTIISHLTGNLMQPKISFEFRLPERSNLKNDPFIIKKLDDYRNDENEMNKQVASLLLFNTFISGNQNFLSGENILSQATSTIGGVVSGWLTNMFNKELLKATDGVISTYIDINPTINLQLSQLQANVKAGVRILFSKRIYFLIGGNLDYNNPYAQLNRKGLLTPDITLEVLLNNDGSLRIIGFNRTSIDLATGQRNRSGIQLSYRKDFNRLSDIFKSRKKIEKEEQEKNLKEIKETETSN